MDAALGSRLVYLAEQDQDGWHFVTKMPPARGLGEFRYSAGRIYVDTEAGLYEFNPNTAAWVMPQ